MTTCSKHVFMSIGLLAICTSSSANSLLISLADFLIQCLEFLEHLTKSEYLFFIKCGLQILAPMLSVDGWWSVPSLYSSFFGWCDPISLILPVFLGSHLRIPCQCQHLAASPTLSWLLFRSLIQCDRSLCLHEEIQNPNSNPCIVLHTSSYKHVIFSSQHLLKKLSFPRNNSGLLVKD